ncbi:MAG: hypothetical protein K2O42_02820 [Oscillospiraceae bacterium]|nr:hypothetical protein [Oscillospiraceae bacterium]
MQENSQLNYNFDIDQIMQTIRQEIKEKKLDHVILDFEDIPFQNDQQKAGNPDGSPFQLDSLQQSMEYLSIRSQIDPYKQPIEGNFLIKLVKKVLRKLMKFYMMPIITEQNALNLHTANAVRQTNQYILSKTESNPINPAELISRMDALELKQSADRQEIQALRSQIRALTAENEQLRRRLS